MRYHLVFIKLELSIIISVFFLGCSEDWRPLHQGEIAGKPYSITSRNNHSLLGARDQVEFQLCYGDLPCLPIDLNTTDWDRVYSTEIFGKDPFDYTTNVDTDYTSSVRIGERTFLYLLPKSISKEEFDDYVQFFKSESWQQAENTCRALTKDHSPFPHIVGLVYGNPINYTQDFKGLIAGAEYTLRIENDGRIRLLDKLGELNAGLPPKIQMPGKIIQFTSAPTGILTLENLKYFKNHDNKSPFFYFNFVEKTTETDPY